MDSTGSLAASGPLGFLAHLFPPVLARLPGAGRYDVVLLFLLLAAAVHLTFAPNMRWFAQRGGDALDKRGLSFLGLAWASWAMLLLFVLLALFDGPSGAALLEGRHFLGRALSSRPGLGGTYAVVVGVAALLTEVLTAVSRRRFGADRPASGVGAWHGLLVILVALSRFDWTFGALLLMDAFVLGAALSELVSIVLLRGLQARLEISGAGA